MDRVPFNAGDWQNLTASLLAFQVVGSAPVSAYTEARYGHFQIRRVGRYDAHRVEYFVMTTTYAIHRHLTVHMVCAKIIADPRWRALADVGAQRLCRDRDWITQLRSAIAGVDDDG